MPLATDNLVEAEVREKLGKILANYKGEREDLIPILQDTQEAFRYLPAAAMREIARFLNITANTVYGVATFYAQFKLTPLGKKVIRVCRGTACHVRGSTKILAEMEKRLGIKAGETTKDMEYTLETVACIGVCALAPNLMINKETHGNMNPKKVARLFGGKKE